MMERGEIDLPIFSLETNVSYICPDGTYTSDYCEAILHDYGQGGSTVASFGHGNAFASFDYSVLPEIEGLSLELDKCYGVFLLKYYSNGEKFMQQEVWYTSEKIVDGKLKPLVGTPENPYNYIDQGVDEYIFERDGYVMVLSAMDWERYSDKFMGFKVNAEQFYKAWDEMIVPEPYR